MSIEASVPLPFSGAHDPEEMDALAWVQDSSAMMAVHAAERFAHVDEMRREAHAAPRPLWGTTPQLVDRSLRLELAAGLQLTEAAAGRLLHVAEALRSRYAAAWELLHRGATTERHVELLVELVDTVESDLRDPVVPVAVGLAESYAVGEFRRRLKTLVDTVRAATLETRSRDALLRRRVVLEPADDGMAWLLVHLPAVEGEAIMNRLDATARALREAEGETRTLDHLRADVAADLLVDGEVGAYPEHARGIRATVAVTVPVLTLLDGASPTSAPAVVEGVGPIPFERARELCGGASGWMRVLTHPETGMVLSVGRDSYRPPAELRRLVRWRSERCQAPGCGMPAGRCDIDHQRPWAQGGRTELANLAPLCGGHHTMRHHGGWRIRQIPGGVLEWTSPLGRVYVVEPTRRVPVFAPAAGGGPPGDPPF